jgi:branched-chain amino acid transport system permease protein
MIYREAGQFKTTYAEDQQIFPIRPGPDRVSRCSRSPSSACRCMANRVLAPAILIPFLIFARGARPEHPHRLRGQLSLGSAGPSWRSARCGLQLHAAHPGMPCSGGFVLGGL